MRAAPLVIPDADRDVLEKWLRLSSTRAGLVLQARIVLLVGDGIAHAEIAWISISADGGQMACPA